MSTYSDDPTDLPSELPPPRKRGWLYVFLAFGILGVTGLVLSQLYRNMPKRTQVVEKRRGPADRSFYACILSRVDNITADSITATILREIGSDTTRVDMVIGSTMYGKRCTSVSEFGRLIRESMRGSSDLPLGKQTLLLSQVLGVLTKEESPARLYIIGTLNNDGFEFIGKRTSQSAAAVELHSRTMAPANVVFYLQPATADVHVKYLAFWKDRGFPVEIR